MASQDTVGSTGGERTLSRECREGDGLRFRKAREMPGRVGKTASPKEDTRSLRLSEALLCGGYLVPNAETVPVMLIVVQSPADGPITQVMDIWS
jgi:hypothetical protein